MRKSLTVAEYRGLIAAKKNKYGTAEVSDRTYKGIRYDSKREALFAWELELRKDLGEFTHIERQVKLPIMVNGTMICNVVLDFRARVDIVHVRYFEVKGFETPVWRLKRKLLMACYPDIDLEIVR